MAGQKKGKPALPITGKMQPSMTAGGGRCTIIRPDKDNAGVVEESDTQACAALAERLRRHSVENAAVNTPPGGGAVLNQKLHAARDRGP